MPITKLGCQSFVKNASNDSIQVGWQAADERIPVTLVSHTGPTELATSTNPLYIRPYEPQTFITRVNINGGAVGSILCSMMNGTGSGKVMKVHAIKILNARVLNTVGVYGTYALQRITSHTGGTDITANIAPYDTNNTLPAQVTFRSGPTVGGAGNLIAEIPFTTEELSPTGSLAVSDAYLIHAVHGFDSLVMTRPGTQPFTVRPSEGFAVYSSGSFTTAVTRVVILFTLE